MKRLLPLAALLVICLLAGQPVLSSLACVDGMAVPCVPSCPMAMGEMATGMAPDCPMEGMTAAESCPQTCCANHVLEAVLQQAPPDKARLAHLGPSYGFVNATAASEPSSPVTAPFELRSSSPPRYILNRVFRI
jgi:hypothetical protein